MADTTREFAAGNYRFIPAVFQYSSGAAADPGYEVERVRFDRLVPLADGFAQVANYIQAAGRPLTSFCAASCVRPRPSPRTVSGPSTSITSRRSPNGDCSTGRPIRWRAAMSAPRSIRRPSHRFMRSPSPGRVKRGAELRHCRRRRGARGAAAIPSASCATATQPEGVREKVRFTAGEMEGVSARSGSAGRTRQRCRPTPCTILSRDGRRAGPPRRDAFRPDLALCAPPVIDLEFEMDCRRVTRETVI